MNRSDGGWRGGTLRFLQGIGGGLCYAGMVTASRGKF